MESKVIIVEINGIGLYRVFSTGTSFTVCNKEEVLRHIGGRVHMFVLVASNIDKMGVYKISSYFFKSSQIESMSVMYSSVATSLSLGVQNVTVISIERGPDDSILWSIDLVQKSSLNCTHSTTRATSYEEALDMILHSLHTAAYKNAPNNLFIKGDKILSDKILEEITKRSILAPDEEISVEDSPECGYKLVSFPKYFYENMPHNLHPGSDIAYVGAVLTIMINYFEIKEVNTREDFEAGHTKNLLLN